MANPPNFVSNSRGKPVESRYSELTLSTREKTLKGTNPSTVGQILTKGDPVALELVKLGRLNDPRAQQPITTKSKPAVSSTSTGKQTGSQASSKSAKEEVKTNFRTATNFDKNNPFGINSTQNESFNLDRRAGDTFNISKFRGQVASADNVLPMHSFLVVFSPMTWVPNSAIRDGVDSLLTMRCENAILPTLNLLQEQNVRRYGFGPVENVAYGVNVGDFTLQFIVDKQARVIDFFEAWMNKIVNRDSFGGANINNNVGDRKTPYEVAYKDTYACPSVNVFVYDRAQNTVIEYNIYDVFPTGIQSMNFSWSEENSLMKLNVTFSFTDLRIRPKVSVFDQGTIIPTVDKLGNEPIAVTKDIAIDVGVLSDPATLAINLPASTLNQPLVIGDPTNARNFEEPTNTPAAVTSTPEKTPPKTWLPSGVPFTIGS